MRGFPTCQPVHMFFTWQHEHTVKEEPDVTWGHGLPLLCRETLQHGRWGKTLQQHAWHGKRWQDVSGGLVLVAAQRIVFFYYLTNGTEMVSQSWQKWNDDEWCESFLEVNWIRIVSICRLVVSSIAPRCFQAYCARDAERSEVHFEKGNDGVGNDFILS